MVSARQQRQNEERRKEDERRKREAAKDLNPVAFKGNVPVPAREDPQLAAQQAEERRKADIPGIQEQELATAQERKATIEKQLLTPSLEEGREKILEQPSLAPEPILERITPDGLPELTPQGEFVKNLFTGKASTEDIIKEAKNFATGVGIVGAGIAAVFAAPHLAVFASRSVIGKAVTGKAGSVPGLRIAIEGLALFAFGGAVFDFQGSEMEVYRGQVQKVIEDGERIEASNKNGFPTSDTIELLNTISEEVNFAEQRIRELGNNNIQYRVSKEYLLDASKIRSARIALNRRVEAVINLAATGQIVINPQA